MSTRVAGSWYSFRASVVISLHRLVASDLIRAIFATSDARRASAIAARFPPVLPPLRCLMPGPATTTMLDCIFCGHEGTVLLVSFQFNFVETANKRRLYKVVRAIRCGECSTCIARGGRSGTVVFSTLPIRRKGTGSVRHDPGMYFG